MTSTHAKRRKGTAGHVAAVKLTRSQGLMSTWRGWVLGSAVAAIVTLLYAILVGYVALLPAVTVPLMTGALVGLLIGEVVPALAWGALSGLAGSMVASLVFAPEAFGQSLSNMQPWMRPDILNSAFQSLYNLVAANQINTTFGAQARPLFVLIALVISGLAAAGVAYVCRSEVKYRRVVEWSVVGLACACMIFSTYAGSADLRAQMGVEPSDGAYAYDPVFNLRTYYLMRDGQGFYPSYIYSIAKDKRYIEQDMLQDGKMVGGSASMAREPLAFFVWTIVGFRSPNGILWFSMLCAAGVMALGYAAFAKPLGSCALLVPLSLLPAMLLHGMWLNILFPDWWGALAFMASAFTLAMGRWRTSIALGVAAALFRELFCVWLIVAAIASWAQAIRDRAVIRQASGFSAGLIVALVGYYVHVMVGSRFMVDSASAGAGVLAVMKGTLAQPLMTKAWPAVYYLMTPYFMTVVSPAILLVTGTAGFLVVGMPRSARLALAGYIVVTAAMYFTVGTHSSYWGQDVMPFAVAGSAVLVGIGLVRLMPPDSRPVPLD